METSVKDYLGIPSDLIPWFPSVDAQSCNGCSICVKACKHEVFAYDSARKKALRGKSLFLRSILPELPCSSATRKQSPFLTKAG